MLHILSLGAGVQSSTLALMFARGDLAPMPDAAIFADTGAEPQAVYTHLEWLKTVLPFPVHLVQERHGLTANIEGAIKGGRFAGAPFFAQTETRAAPLRRQCTREFKIQPIIRKVRELVGLEKGRPGPKRIIVQQYIGISHDEAIRRKPSRVRWINHNWPLLERQMTRQDCLRWLEERQFPRPPRSACVYCPYRSDAEWAHLRDTDPEGFAEAVRVDALIRTGVRGVRDPIFVHRSLKPLDQVKFTHDERGQPDLFNNDCEGMCGV